jgi:branched-subunit amino acid transport protein AzlD
MPLPTLGTCVCVCVTPISVLEDLHTLGEVITGTVLAKLFLSLVVVYLDTVHGTTV